MNKEKDNSNNNELFIPKTKHKALKIILAILLIAGIAFLGYIIYQNKFNNPKNIVNNLIEESKHDVKRYLQNDIKGTKYKVNGLIKIDGNLGNELKEILAIFKDIDLQFNGEIDTVNSISNIEFNTKYQNEKLLDIKAYYEKDDMYIFLEELYDKYIKFDLTKDEKQLIEDIPNMPNLKIDPNDLEMVINAILDSFQKEVIKLDFKRENETITIDNEKYNAINNYVELKGKEFNNFIKNIIKDLENNSGFINTFKKLTNKDVKEAFSEALNGIDNEEFNGTYKINFYTNNGIFKKKLLSIRQEITQDGIKMTYSIDKINDNEMLISMSSMGITYSIKVKRNNSNLNISVKTDMLGMYYSIDMSLNYENLDEIKRPDISNYKKIDDLTEEEKKAIEEKLSSNETLKKLMEEIKKNSLEEATV